MKNDQVTPAETATICELAESCIALDGDFVELGCYRGDTSVLLGKLLQKHDRELSTDLCTDSQEFYTKNKQLSTETPDFSTNNGEFSTKKLWIYDSFAGLPAKTREDASGAGANFQAGELFVTKREVVEKIRRAGLKNVIIKKAWFNELTERDLPSEVAFGFLDGDLYGSIRVSLQLVAPRLVKNGIMVVHDYNNPELPGSSRAVDEFLRSHREYKLQVKHTLAIISAKLS